MPFPGWHKPGVMTAGAGQILLKSAALVPQQAPVLVGSGPLLLLLAWQYLRAGVGVQAIVDTTPKANRWRALRHLPRALAASDTLFKGLQLVMAIKRARVPWYKQATDLRAEGGECVERLKFNSRGIAQQLDTRLVMLHQGVIPAFTWPRQRDVKRSGMKPSNAGNRGWIIGVKAHNREYSLPVTAPLSVVPALPL